MQLQNRLNKQHRQRKLVELLNEKEFSSQQDIVGAMQREGFLVTQPSISRDFRELGIVRVRGRYISLHGLPKSEDSNLHVDELIRSIEMVGDHLIVVKSNVGAASVVALRFENENLDGVAGTIAGDDTIFIAVRNKRAQTRAMQTIQQMRGGELEAA